MSSIKRHLSDIKREVIEMGSDPMIIEMKELKKASWTYSFSKYQGSDSCEFLEIPTKARRRWIVVFI